MSDNREQLEAGTLKRLTGEVRDCRVAIEMPGFVQRRGMTYDQH